MCIPKQPCTCVLKLIFLSERNTAVEPLVTNYRIATYDCPIASS